MTIRFSCDTCGAPVSAPDTLAGARSRCPKCRGAVLVPRRLAGVAPPRPPRVATQPARPGGKPLQATAATDHSARTAGIAPRRRRLVGAAAALLLALSGAAAVAAWTVRIVHSDPPASPIGAADRTPTGRASPSATAPAAVAVTPPPARRDTSYKGTILALIKRNLHDTDGFEVVAWSKAKPARRQKLMTGDEVIVRKRDRNVPDTIDMDQEAMDAKTKKLLEQNKKLFDLHGGESAVVVQGEKNQDTIIEDTRIVDITEFALAQPDPDLVTARIRLKNGAEFTVWRGDVAFKNQPYEPVRYVTIKFRAKNKLGAKVLSKETFFVLADGSIKSYRGHSDEDAETNLEWEN